MSEELDVKLWPLGDANTYIEIKNPKYLLQDFPSGEVPFRITSYRNETPDSLKEVQKQTANALLPILYPSPYKKVIGDAIQLVSTSITDGAVLGLSLINSPSPVLEAVGLSTFISITGMSAAIGYIRKKDFNKKTNKVQTNLEIFKKTPINKIEVVKDDELEDICNAIESNKPLKMLKPKCEDSFNSIYSIIHGEFGSILHGGERLPSRTREVYKQKIDAYKGRIVRV